MFSNPFSFYKPTQHLEICLRLSLFITALLCPIVEAANGNTSYSERYELCKPDAEIQQLQQTYDLIVVTSTPTKAAMHPGWPETLRGVASSSPYIP